MTILASSSRWGLCCNKPAPLLGLTCLFFTAVPPENTCRLLSFCDVHALFRCPRVVLFLVVCISSGPETTEPERCGAFLDWDFTERERVHAISCAICCCWRRSKTNSNIWTPFSLIHVRPAVLFLLSHLSVGSGHSANGHLAKGLPVVTELVVSSNTVCQISALFPVLWQRIV